MRPILRLSPVALAALVTLVAVPAFADGSGGVTVGPARKAGDVKFTAPAAMHMNKDYPWKIKDGSGKALRHNKNGDFTFEGGSGDHPTSASVTPVAGTLTGGYCDDDTNKPGAGCHTFTATCTDKGCTLN